MEDISIDSARLKGKGTDLMDSGSAKPFSRGNDEESVAERQRFVEEELGAGTDRVKRDTYPSDAVEGNIENYIGTTKVPIGLAGPLLIHGDHAQGNFYAPLATTGLPAVLLVTSTDARPEGILSAIATIEASSKTASGKMMRMAGILIGGFPPTGCHSLLSYSNDLVLLDPSWRIDRYDIAEF